MLRLKHAAITLMAAMLCGSSIGTSYANAREAAPDIAWINRLTWGASSSTELNREKFFAAEELSRQINALSGDLPSAAKAQVAAMNISRTSMPELIEQMQMQNQAISKMADGDEKLLAQKAYEKKLYELAGEARQRFILRALYAPGQLREMMTWFWFNHFNVFSGKLDIRAMLGDYEDTLRLRAFSKFRDLLEATVRHPAMLRYLDNDRNSVGHTNENYAREIMELHTMGEGSGYSQKDVQELARILTGVGIRVGDSVPKLKPELKNLYIRDGLFEFNPKRHDFGNKQFLGRTIKGSGFNEVEQALDILARSPATAKRVSSQIALYFMGDKPPSVVVQKMTQTFQRTDGDIAEVIRTMVGTAEFSASLGKNFKNPVQYTISALRLAYGNDVILNPQVVVGWLRQMGESLYDRPTPEGFSMSTAAWSAPGQMATRFDIARQIGGGSRALFLPAGASNDRTIVPKLSDTVQSTALMTALSAKTRAALADANSIQEWYMLLLSSPEFMYR